MKLPRDPASLQAMRYITLFDEALKKRGVQVLVGMEEEFTAENMSGMKTEDLASHIDSTFRQLPRQIAPRLKIAEGSPNIKNGPILKFQNEENFEQHEFATTPGLPLQAAHRMAGLIARLARSEHEPSAAHGAPFKHISLASYASDEFATVLNGMHMNISFNGIQKQNGTTTFLPMMNDSKKPSHEVIRPCLGNYLRAVTCNDALLLCNHPDFFKRYHHIAKYPVKLKPEPLNIGDNYVEWRSPGADSNPYLSVMMAMAAAYEMLQGMSPHTADTALSPTQLEDHCEPLYCAFDTPTVYDKAPMNIKEASQRFEKDSIVLRAMNHVALASGMDREQAEADVRDFKASILHSMHQGPTGMGAAR